MNNLKNPNKNIPTLILFAIGLLFPLLIMLIIDWCYFKYNVTPPISGWVFWILYLIFTSVVLYFSYIRINAKPIWASVLAVLTAVVFVPVLIFAVLSFHVWIR